MNCDGYCQAWWGTWYPWAEANQGLISIVALATALALFLLENGRANREAADAAKAREEARAKEQADKLAAIEKARRDDEARRLDHVLDFTVTANGIIAEVQRDMMLDRLAIDQHPNALFPTRRLRAKARAAAGSLVAILGVAPMHPKLVLNVREAAELLTTFADSPSNNAPAGMKEIDTLDQQLTEMKSTISEHHRAMRAELRPEIAGSLFETPGAIEVACTHEL